jgi:hypothetical protein
MQIAERAFDDQSIGADGIAMSTARNEGHIMTRSCHARAEISADRARRHCHNPHEKSVQSRPGGSFRFGR